MTCKHHKKLAVHLYISTLARFGGSNDYFEMALLVKIDWANPPVLHSYWLIISQFCSYNHYKCNSWLIFDLIWIIITLINLTKTYRPIKYTITISKFAILMKFLWTLSYAKSDLYIDSMWFKGKYRIFFYRLEIK